MKLKAYHVGLVVILATGLTFAEIDLLYIPDTIPEWDYWWGFGFGLGIATPIVAVSLGVYYGIKRLSSHRQKSKSYI